MRVALNADFGQMDNRDIATMLVHRVPPFPRHLQTSAPSILPRICHWFFGDEIAVIDDDGNFGEQHKFSPGDSNPLQRPTGTLNRSGHFAFREDETAARLVGDDGTDILVLDGRAPSEAATVRMCDENSWPDLIEERRYGTRHHGTIERACGWGHRAKVLVQRLRVVRKLHAGE